VAVLVAVFDGVEVAVFVAVFVAVLVAVRVAVFVAVFPVVEVEVAVAVLVAVPGIDVGVAVLTTGFVVFESHPTIKAAGGKVIKNKKLIIFFIFASPFNIFESQNFYEIQGVLKQGPCRSAIAPNNMTGDR
jgi:hypothetical protein